MSHWNKYLLSIFMFIGVLSCNKSTDSNSTPMKTYTFNNASGRKVYLDFYKNKTDLNKNQNSTNHLVVNNGEDVSIDLEPKKTVYIDWYSEDYVLTNWINNKSNGEVTPYQNFYADTLLTNFSITKPDTVTQVVYNRRLLLNKNQANNDWKAISFYPDFGTANTWEQIPSFQKFLEFSFQKDFYMLCHYQDSSGAFVDVKTTMKIYYDKFKLAFTNTAFLKGEIFMTPTISYDTLEFHITDFGPRRGMYQLVRK